MTTLASLRFLSLMSCLCAALLCSVSTAMAQMKIRGTVTDKKGKGITGGQVFIVPDSIRTNTDGSGVFQAKVRPGKVYIVVTHVAHDPVTLELAIRSDTSFRFAMDERIYQLNEIEITGERSAADEQFHANQTSSHVLTQDEVKGIPVLGGEADIIKTLQLLPGTMRGVEGSSDLFVRGGAADQNLVLLDDVPIYNTSHLFGFLSVFNADVLDRVQAINGGFPAVYGGRLSSVLDVRTRSIIPDRTQVSGDIGLIASRLFIETPIIKNKLSVWAAGRRTYIDQVIRLTGEELPYYFYDLNGKLIFRPTSKDLIEVSHYSGVDELDLFRDGNGDGDGFLTSYVSGNSSQSVKWSREINSRWSGTVSGIRTQYRYNILNAFDDNEVVARSNIEDYGVRLSMQRDSIFGKGSFKTGMEWIRHNVSPSVVNSSGSITAVVESSTASGRVAHEAAAFAQYESSPVRNLVLNVGLRASAAVVGTKHYFVPEPRLSARYSLRGDEAIKFSYSRMAQYMHRISNSAVSTPTDIWYPVTSDIKPQTAHQVALAWQRKFSEREFFLSVEGYYKSMRELIGFEEGTNLFLNTDFESKLIQGDGRAYGLEVLLRKDVGRLTGWLSYTLSWSWRRYDGLNNGEWFPSRYDRRHNAALVTQYAITKRWAVSLVWEYISGARFTPVIGQYLVLAPTLSGVDLIPVYAGLNSVRLADSHRLDLGMKYKSRPGAKFQWQIFAGAYNVYNRANPIGINIEQDETDGSLRYTQPGLFGFLPFISYGFKF